MNSAYLYNNPKQCTSIDDFTQMILLNAFLEKNHGP